MSVSLSLGPAMFMSMTLSLDLNLSVYMHLLLAMHLVVPASLHGCHGLISRPMSDCAYRGLDIHGLV